MTLSKDSTKAIRQPSTAAILATRPVKADLHNHLRTGSDMKGLFNKAIDQAQLMLGQGGMFALVNFEDARYERFSEQKGYERKCNGCSIYIPEKDILVVKGQEVPTEDGHLLVLGLNKGVHLKSNKPLTYTFSEAIDNSGIIIADHPFYTGGIGSFFARHYSGIVNNFDAIEGFNASAELYIPGVTTSSANREAKLVYDFICHDSPDLGFISASDGHSIRELGRSYTTIRMPDYTQIKNSRDLRDYLREAIKKSRPEDCTMVPAKLGCAMHIAALAYSAAMRKLTGRQ